MDAEIKAKWVAALRSGEYRQGHETLHRDDKFCCLGVLCDIDGAVWERARLAGDGTIYHAEGIGTEELDPDYRAEIGLPLDIHVACMSLNDGNISEAEAARWGVEIRCHSFAEIADWLETNL